MTLNISSLANSFVHGLTNDQKVSHAVKNCEYSCFKIQDFVPSSLCEDVVLFTSQDRTNIIFQKQRTFSLRFQVKSTKTRLPFASIPVQLTRHFSLKLPWNQGFVSFFAFHPNRGCPRSFLKAKVSTPFRMRQRGRWQR